LQKRAHFFAHHVQPVGLHHVNFGQGHKAGADAEQGAYFKMFARLGHYAFVGRHDQHNKIHPCRACNHIFDKALVPRHVHNAQPFAAGQVHPGKAQLDGDAPAFFFAQTVAIDARKGAHKRGLAVVDMPCRAQHYCHKSSLDGLAPTLHAGTGLCKRPNSGQTQRRFPFIKGTSLGPLRASGRKNGMRPVAS